MVNIAHLRIDSRLIHGQIVTAWISDVHANEIIVADDKVCNDSFQISLLKMACPPAVKLQILSLKDTIEYINNGSDAEKALVIVKDVQGAKGLLDLGLDIKEINVGNIPANKQRKQFSKSVWLTEDEIGLFKEIEAKGVECIVQVVPSEKRTGLKVLIG